MSVRTIACAVSASLFLSSVVPAAAGLELIPVAGALPLRLHVTQVVATADGPQTMSSTLELRRTGPASAVLQRDADLTPLVIDPGGVLRPADSTPGAVAPDVATLLGALNIALAIAGAPGAGDKNGWTAQIPAPPPRRPAAVDDDAAPAPPASPAPTLLLPVRTIAANVGGDLDIDGSVETTVAAPAAAHSQRSRGGGGFGGGMGGFGGFGGRGGGRGGGYEGGEAPRSGLPPVTLDVHISGHIAGGALRRMSIAQMRRITLDGLAYTNAGNTTIEIMR